MANKTAHVYADTSTIVLVSVLCDVYVNYDRTCRAFTMWYSRVSGSLQFLSCERFACVILILIRLASKWMHLATLGRHTCLHSRAAATAAAFPDFLQVFLRLSLSLGRWSSLVLRNLQRCGMRWWSVHVRASEVFFSGVYSSSFVCLFYFWFLFVTLSHL